jgi:hypothetical protein
VCKEIRLFLHKNVSQRPKVTEPLDISYSACSLDFGPKVPFFGHERAANAKIKSEKFRN